MLINRHDEQVKRGAVVKALAFGCKQKVLLEPLSLLIQRTLETIINETDFSANENVNLQKYEQIIQHVFRQVNCQAHKFTVHRGNFLERAVSLDLGTNCAWKPAKEFHFEL